MMDDTVEPLILAFESM